MGVRLTDEERRLRAITEAEWQRTVIEYAQYRGWRVAHFRPAQTAKGKHLTAVAADGAGFPDLVMARDGRIVFAELKRMTGRLSDAQEVWLEVLDACAFSVPALNKGVEVFVWLPCDWALVELILA